jgi:hypothetical protein
MTHFYPVVIIIISAPTTFPTSDLNEKYTREGEGGKKCSGDPAYRTFIWINIFYAPAHGFPRTSNSISTQNIKICIKAEFFS